MAAPIKTAWPRLAACARRLRAGDARSVEPPADFGARVVNFAFRVRPPMIPFSVRFAWPALAAAWAAASVAIAINADAFRLRIAEELPEAIAAAAELVDNDTEAAIVLNALLAEGEN